MTIAYFSLMTATILALALAVRFRSQRNTARKLSADNQAICDAWETEIVRIKGISNNYVKSCRLIALHRNGRLNVWTFSRGDQLFTIETMGVYADNPAEWRQLAGLDQQQ